MNSLSIASFRINGLDYQKQIENIEQLEDECWKLGGKRTTDGYLNDVNRTGTWMMNAGNLVVSLLVQQRHLAVN